MTHQTSAQIELFSFVVQADRPALRHYLLDLFCQVAYQEGEFVLSSGQRSTYYINGKQVTLHPLGGTAVGRIIVSLLPPTIQAVAGLTLGADPIVTATSVVATYEGRSITPLIVRKEAKGHGTQAYIEGLMLPPNTPVVVLEDVVTTGQSALKAVERLRQAGYSVTQIIALVDRHQGGAELYEQQNLDFQAVFSIQEIQARSAEIREG
ncbi:MAG: orotate phosphoribosyltransferase [Cyanobacteria bacterium CRU_2_1]|nr:orotate phosphoribosyltransferase [Cyanobacteria bacterium RU_5_0]NJR61252.1 orotate phosphoribosyltransferase [Cyanobacteria bacterium CRU_2_1]